MSYSVRLGPQKMFDTSANLLTTMLSLLATGLIGSTNLAAPMTRNEQIRRCVLPFIL